MRRRLKIVIRNVPFLLQIYPYQTSCRHKPWFPHSPLVGGYTHLVLTNVYTIISAIYLQHPGRGAFRQPATRDRVAGGPAPNYLKDPSLSHSDRKSCPITFPHNFLSNCGPQKRALSGIQFTAVRCPRLLCVQTSKNKSNGPFSYLATSNESKYSEE